MAYPKASRRTAPKAKVVDSKEHFGKGTLRPYPTPDGSVLYSDPHTDVSMLDSGNLLKKLSEKNEELMHAHRMGLGWSETLAMLEQAEELLPNMNDDVANLQKFFKLFEDAPDNLFEYIKRGKVVKRSD